MLRVAWWLIVAYAVHNALAMALWWIGLVPSNDIERSLLFYGVLYIVVLACARRHLDAPWAELAPRRGMSLWLVIPIASVTAGGLFLNQQSIRICELLNVLSPETVGLAAGARGAGPPSQPPLLTALVADALLPAVFEEALNRGLVLTALAATMSKRRAIVVSSLFFAAMHLQIERICPIPS